MISDDFLMIPRLNLAPLRSPVEKMERLSAAIKGAPNLYIKRDDFIGQLVWGNKLRKLEYTFAHALSLGCDMVITCGGIQSNHARTTAQIAKRLGLECILVLNGSEPDMASGNFKVLRLMGTSIVFVKESSYRKTEMEKIARDMKVSGRHPYIIPIGASDETGMQGFVYAMKELKDQEAEAGIKFTHIYHSTSSGGTQAGLEAGKSIFGSDDLRITGISANTGYEELAEQITGMCNSLFKKLNSGNRTKTEDITIYTDFIGEGYGIPTSGSERAKKDFLNYEGILLDDTYTAKAADGLITHCENGWFNHGDNVLFWHTGGIISLL